MDKLPCVDHGGKGNLRGYQTCWYNGRYIGKHVKALILHSGQPPDGRHACHTCDNPRCIEPTHLFWGTRSDNMQDCVAKGRHANNLSNVYHGNWCAGEDKPNARFQEQDIIEMRRLYAAKVTQVEIARLFSCRQSDVSRIVRRKAWANVR